MIEGKKYHVAIVAPSYIITDLNVNFGDDINMSLEGGDQIHHP